MDFDFSTETITPDNTALLTIGGTGAIEVPTGNTANRPVTGLANGALRYNTDVNNLEGFVNSTWTTISTGTPSVTLTGDVTGTGTSSVATTLATVNSNIGTFASVTVNAKGLVTAAANLTGDITSSGAATTLATVNANVGTFASATFNAKGLATAAANLSGDATTSGAVLTLATVNGSPVTASFQKLTTNGKGLVTATTAVSASDITTALTYTPVNKAGDTMNTNASLTFSGTGTVTGLPTPVNASDAAPKSYVDSSITGLTWKQAVKASSTTALTVTYSNGTSGVGATLTNAGAQAAFQIDGYTASVNDRILIKNQASTFQNGIYSVTTVGSGASNWVLTRTTDANTGPALDGSAVYVQQGSTLADTGWTETGTVVTVGTDPVVYVQFSGSGAYAAGTGLSLTGNTFANTGVLSITSNTGLSSNVAATGAVTITNTGVTSNVAGTNITVSGATGAVTISTSTTPSFSTVTSTVATGTAPFTVTSTTNVPNLNASSLNGATFAAPGPIGSTTASTGAFTTLSASSTVSGTGFSTYLASPPAIGGTAAAAGTFTALTANGVISHSTGTNSQTYTTTGAGTITISSGTAGSIDNMNIGATTAGTGRFTTLTATGLTANSFLYSGTAGLLSTTTAPTNGQLLIGSTGAAPVVASLTSGTGISITPGAGSISIANTGVTSVGLSLPAFLTVSGSPVTTTGTLTATLASQTANTAFLAPNGSAGAPTFRALAYADLPLKLYIENPSTPTAPLAAGANAIGFGSGTSASATSSEAHGLQSIARVYGQVATAAGQFATLGDSQHSEYNLRIITSSATPAEVFLDGSAARLVLPNNSAFMFVADVVCRRTDSTGTVGAWTISGLIFRDGSAATTAISGAVSKTTIAKAPSTMDVTTTADTTNGSLKLTVTGVASQTIRWSVYIRTQEVTN